MATNLAIKPRVARISDRRPLIALKHKIRAAVRPFYNGEGEDDTGAAFENRFQAVVTLIKDMPLASVVALYHHLHEELAVKPNSDFDFEGTALQSGLTGCVWRIINALNLSPADAAMRAQFIFDTVIPNHQNLDIPDSWFDDAFTRIVADLRRRQF